MSELTELSLITEGKRVYFIVNAVKNAKLKSLEPQFWIWCADATRRMPGAGIPQAKEILAKAQVLFPKDCLIPLILRATNAKRGT